MVYVYVLLRILDVINYGAPLCLDTVRDVASQYFAELLTENPVRTFGLLNSEGKYFTNRWLGKFCDRNGLSKMMNDVKEVKKVHECDICGYKCSWPRNLIVHRKKVHFL